MKRGKGEKPFVPAAIGEKDVKKATHHDWAELYNRAHSELSLQQTKRDQIITVYIAIASFLIPFALSADGLNLQAKGLIFLASAVIGVLFTVITVRYRIYKEIYWLCCETITCLTNLEEEKLNKNTVQAMFYFSMKKRGKKYFKEGKRGEYWSSAEYFKGNIFSSETLHYIILALMSCILLGLSAFLLLPLSIPVCIAVSAAVGLAALAALLAFYFRKCEDVYAVLQDGTNASFNRAFSKAWFLHIYFEIKPDDLTVPEAAK